MLATALFMMSCRSSKPTVEQTKTERGSDTVYKTEYVFVHDTTTKTVYDTVRETTTVFIGPEGDTTRKDTEREHITDRSRDQRNEIVREATHQESHEKETTSDKKETVVEQPKRKGIKPYLWGALAGIVLTTAVIIFERLRKR